MPQTFQVLRCFKCFVFQVHISKKSNKWECKLCGEKQSIKRHYGIGTAKDCRMHVQKLNSKRGEIDELKSGQSTKNLESDEDIIDASVRVIVSQSKVAKESKWRNFVEETEPVEETASEPMYLGEAEVVLETPQTGRKQFTKKAAITATKVHKPLNNNTNKTDQKINTAPQTLCSLREQYNEVEIFLPNYFNELQAEKKNSKPNVTNKKFVPPVVNKNSKWAQFAVDEEPASEWELTQSIPEQTKQMFSLCDDTELDNVLNF